MFLVCVFVFVVLFIKVFLSVDTVIQIINDVTGFIQSTTLSFSSEQNNERSHFNDLISQQDSIHKNTKEIQDLIGYAQNLITFLDDNNDWLSLLDDLIIEN